MSEAAKTTDHEEIRRWAEERGGRPARVASTADKGGGGLLRIDFGEPEESLEEIAWETFFDIFERTRLALLLQDRTEDGGMSRFSKFVDRNA